MCNFDNNNTTSSSCSSNNKKKMSAWVDEHGKIVGLDVGLSVHAAQDLARKLTFLHPHQQASSSSTKSKESMNPFAGLQILRGLQSSSSSSPDIDLLLAAEYTRFFPVQAKGHLERYLDAKQKQADQLMVASNKAVKDPFFQATMAKRSSGADSGKPDDTDKKNDYKKQLILQLVSERVQLLNVAKAPTNVSKDEASKTTEPFGTIMGTDYELLLTAAEKKSLGMPVVVENSTSQHANSHNKAPTQEARLKDLQQRFEKVKGFAAIGDLRENVDQLEQLVGLQSVKEMILDLLFYRFWSIKDNFPLGCRKQFCIVGGSGTGKSTVALLLRSILKSLEPDSNRNTYSGKTFGIDADTSDVRNLCSKSYITLIDDAHTLDVKKSKYGEDNLGAMQETLIKTEKSWFIITGDEEELKTTFLKGRLGTAFQIIRCDPFTEDEMREFWIQETAKGGWKNENEKVPRTAAKVS